MVGIIDSITEGKNELIRRLKPDLVVGAWNRHEALLRWIQVSPAALWDYTPQIAFGSKDFDLLMQIEPALVSGMCCVSHCPDDLQLTSADLARRYAALRSRFPGKRLISIPRFELLERMDDSAARELDLLGINIHQKINFQLFLRGQLDAIIDRTARFGDKVFVLVTFSDSVRPDMLGRVIDRVAKRGLPVGLSLRGRQDNDQMVFDVVSPRLCRKTTF